MIEWTPAAREELARHVEMIGPRLVTAGADLPEVQEDLRRHVEEESAAAGLSVITAEDVRRVLRQVGEPDPSLNESPELVPPPPPAIQDPPAEPAKRGFLSSTSLVLFGIVLPAVTLLIELSTGMCADAFFNPIPTWWHVALVAIVPLSNLLCWSYGRQARGGWLEWLNALSIGISLIYALLFVPLLPLAIIAILGFGMGLLPMAPLFSLIVAIRCRREVRRYSPENGRVRHARFFAGMSLGVALLIGVEIPGALTRIGLSMAASDEPVRRTQGIHLLRRFGRQETMLRACYQRPRGGMDLVGALLRFSGDMTTESARETFYRVTGQAFSAFPPPHRRSRAMAWEELEFDFDAEQGGSEVGGRVRNLALASSRIDASVDADAALAYYEWTLVFHNASERSIGEARAEISLPTGGVVSRLTLWVDGQEREAAFAGRDRVRDAYQGVVRQRRDPVLVTTRGPDRVLAQCFPVPPRGDMKIRVGITAPLPLDQADEAIVPLPRFVNRNFAIDSTMEHSIWIESHSPIRSGTGALTSEHPEERVFAVRGKLPDSVLANEAGLLRVTRNTDSVLAWAPDPLDTAGHAILQRITRTPRPKPDRVVIVVDGSRLMGPILPQVAAALDALPAGIDLGLIAASDKVEVLSPPRGEAHTPYTLIADQIRKLRCVGGCDNAPALTAAWDLAAAHPNSLILWISGPQPHALSPATELQQRWERRPDGPRLLCLQALAGPHHLAQELDGIEACSSIRPTGAVEAELKRLFAEWSGKSDRLIGVRERIATSAMPADVAAKGTSAHLARLWASDEVRRLLKRRTTTPLESMVRIAADYQVVTPISGAVVLETKQQYDAAGLKPVEPGSVPTIPEPGTWALMIIVALVVLYAVYQRRRACRLA